MGFEWVEQVSGERIVWVNPYSKGGKSAEMVLWDAINTASDNTTIIVYPEAVKAMKR